MSPSSSFFVDGLGSRLKRSCVREKLHGFLQEINLLLEGGDQDVMSCHTPLKPYGMAR